MGLPTFFQDLPSVGKDISKISFFGMEAPSAVLNHHLHHNGGVQNQSQQSPDP